MFFDIKSNKFQSEIHRSILIMDLYEYTHNGEFENDILFEKKEVVIKVNLDVRDGYNVSFKLNNFDSWVNPGYFLEYYLTKKTVFSKKIKESKYSPATDLLFNLFYSIAFIDKFYDNMIDEQFVPSEFNKWWFGLRTDDVKKMGLIS